MNKQDELIEIERLRKQLQAERVSQTEVYAHYSARVKWQNGAMVQDIVMVAYQPRIAVPDTAKREKAVLRLQQLHESSEWEIVKRAAGEMLASIK